MTTHEDNTFKGDLRRFVSAKEARRGSELPAHLRSEEQIRREMKESVKRNAQTLKVLSKL